MCTSRCVFFILWVALNDPVFGLVGAVRPGTQTVALYSKKCPMLHPPMHDVYPKWHKGVWVSLLSTRATNPLRIVVSIGSCASAHSDMRELINKSCKSCRH